jgi:hypothetical protein
MSAMDLVDSDDEKGGVDKQPRAELSPDSTLADVLAHVFDDLVEELPNKYKEYEREDWIQGIQAQMEEADVSLKTLRQDPSLIECIVNSTGLVARITNAVRETRHGAGTLRSRASRLSLVCRLPAFPPSCLHPRACVRACVRACAIPHLLRFLLAALLGFNRTRPQAAANRSAASTALWQLRHGELRLWISGACPSTFGWLLAGCSAGLTPAVPVPDPVRAGRRPGIINRLGRLLAERRERRGRHRSLHDHALVQARHRGQRRAGEDLPQECV